MRLCAEHRVFYTVQSVNGDELITELHGFIEDNIADAERVASCLHKRRVETGTLAAAWFDPEFDQALIDCRVELNIARHGLATSNRWLLSQLAAEYSGHPLWNDDWMPTLPTTTPICS